MSIPSAFTVRQRTAGSRALVMADVHLTPERQTPTPRDHKPHSASEEFAGLQNMNAKPYPGSRAAEVGNQRARTRNVANLISEEATQRAMVH